MCRHSEVVFHFLLLSFLLSSTSLFLLPPDAVTLLALYLHLSDFISFIALVTHIFILPTIPGSPLSIQFTFFPPHAFSHSPVSISACSMCMRSFLVEPRGYQVMFSRIAPPVRSISRGRKLEECLCSALFCVSLAGYTVICFYMDGCGVWPHSFCSQIQLEYLV